MSIDAVMARIGEIQSTIGSMTYTRPAMLDSVSQGSVSTESGDTESFAQALESVVSQYSPEAQPSTQSDATSTADSSPLGSLLNAATETVRQTPRAPKGSADPVSAVAKTSSPVTAPDKPAAVSKPKEPQSSGGHTGTDVVEHAKKYLGIPYVWGGNTPKQGFDCSGLVKYVMNELGVSMPRVARDQAKVGTEIASLSQAKPGDLLGMRNGKHIAIYLGDNKILHAPQPGEKVSIRSLFSWDDIDTIRRVLPAGTQHNAQVQTVGTDTSMNNASRLAFEGAAA